MTSRGPYTAISAAERDGVDLDAAAAAVRRCPAVSDLVADQPADFVTYLPGRRITGLRVKGDVVEVAVRARWGTPLPEVAQQVREALASITGGRRVDVTVADLDPPADGSGTGGD